MRLDFQPVFGNRTVSTNRKSKETSRPRTTVVNSVFEDGFFFGKRLQISKGTKLLQSKIIVMLVKILIE